MKVYIVLHNSYSNCEYYDIATWVDKVFTTKEKALAYIESIDGIRRDIFAGAVHLRTGWPCRGMLRDG